MSDVQKAFTFLHDNIPSWIKGVEELAELVGKHQDGITKVPVSVSPPMHRKTGSTASIRDNAMDAIMEESGSTTLVAQNSFLGLRKRKPTSFLSGHASGPLKHRIKTMVVVYYDSDIQKAFEVLVRNIGTGRNLLRKGKMAAKMEALAALAGSDDEDDIELPSAGLPKVGNKQRPGFPGIRTTRAMGGGAGGRNGGTSTELFDTTDKALEQAQGLCEKGAHQFLREADCRAELEGIKKNLNEVFETSEAETAKYKRRGGEAKQRREEAQKEQTSSSPAEILSAPKPTMPALPSISTMPSNPMIPSKTLAIEVDDDDDDDIEFALPQIRLTSRA